MTFLNTDVILMIHYAICWKVPGQRVKALINLFKQNIHGFCFFDKQSRVLVKVITVLSM